MEIIYKDKDEVFISLIQKNLLKDEEMICFDGQYCVVTNFRIIRIFNTDKIISGNDSYPEMESIPLSQITSVMLNGINIILRIYNTIGRDGDISMNVVAFKIDNNAELLEVHKQILLAIFKSN